MYRKIIIAALFLGAMVKGYTQYAAALIPDSLKKDARVVVRLDETVFQIKSPGKASLHEHMVYTILNESGASWAAYRSHYNKFIDINSITATLYDANGKEIKKVKKKDMADWSGSNDETLMTDTRYKIYNFGYGVYPYTVEFEEDDDFDGIRYVPDWNPQQAPGIAVQSSSYKLITPFDYKARYKAVNFKNEPVVTEKSGEKTYLWQINNLSPIEKEVLEPSWDEIVPSVMMAPSTFEAEGYKGDMSTWQDFGKFIGTLLQGRNALPDAVKQKVHELADNIKDEKEKIRVLYEYMQQNTRYISVQIGIGGWQPFDANYVYTKKYGDCKALSNYMVAILNEAGIKAKYVLIAAGADAPPMVKDFSCSQFNHATVCVPMQSDTMWLECTSQTVPAGYIGSFTGNRNALLIDEDGGHVVATKKYTSADNVVTTHIIGKVDATGNLSADISTRYMGLYYSRAHGEATNYSKEEQLKNLKEGINLSTYDVPNFSYDDHKSINPYIDQHIQVVADGGATITGKRLFFTPNFISQNGTRLQQNDKRKFDVVYENDFTQIDTLQFQMPGGYTVEAMPKDVSISNSFGKYEIHFKVDADKVLVSRKYTRATNRFPPAEYNNLVKFYDDMYKADRSKIVFVKKDS